jgi:hypothetical protein
LFPGVFVADGEPCEATWAGDWDWHIEDGCLEQWVETWRRIITDLAIG